MRWHGDFHGRSQQIPDEMSFLNLGLAEDCVEPQSFCYQDDRLSRGIIFPEGYEEVHPIITGSDIHGEFEAIVKILKNRSLNEHVLLLGDYVDDRYGNGEYPIESLISSAMVVFTLLELRHRYPGRISLLRGNHEHMSYFGTVNGFLTALGGDAAAFCNLFSGAAILPTQRSGRGVAVHSTICSFSSLIDPLRDTRGPLWISEEDRGAGPVLPLETQSRILRESGFSFMIRGHVHNHPGVYSPSFTERELIFTNLSSTKITKELVDSYLRIGSPLPEGMATEPTITTIDCWGVTQRSISYPLGKYPAPAIMRSLISMPLLAVPSSSEGSPAPPAERVSIQATFPQIAGDQANVLMDKLRQLPGRGYAINFRLTIDSFAILYDGYNAFPADELVHLLQHPAGIQLTELSDAIDRFFELELRPQQAEMLLHPSSASASASASSLPESSSPSSLLAYSTTPTFFQPSSTDGCAEDLNAKRSGNQGIGEAIKFV